MSVRFKCRNHFVLTCLALGCLIAAGCATSVALQVQRTPNMDTAGIHRIAIMPFEPAGGKPVYRQAAKHATTAVAGKIRAVNRFTPVDPETVNEAKGRGESIEGYVDALFKGEITRINEQTTPQQGQYKDKETGEMVTYTYYVREVEVELAYSFTRARDGVLIGPVNRKGSSSATANDAGDLPSVNTLAAKAIDNSLAYFHQDVAPYTVTVSRPMEKEPNKDLKPQMDAALAHVKGNNYAAARRAYLAVWESHQSVAAAVNASILCEAMGETREAANFMQQVVAATGSPRARDALARLNRELGEKAAMEQFADTRSQTQKAASHAINEIRKVLPDKPKLLILNSAAPNHKNLVDNVVDEMIPTLSRSGAAVVERQMIDKAMEELEFQMGGNVSDEDIVNIGNFAGANIIVAVNITGSGAERRLQIRVLDIATGTVLLQSDPGSDWRL